MKIGVLTSSRADYSIYYPLLKALRQEENIELQVIAFGTHLSELHGYTVSKIKADGFTNIAEINTMAGNDSPAAISESMGECIRQFSSFWEKNSFDLVFCLGDRYEMFAACAASVPFNIRLAHIHGGEETLGAIDDAFRHSITHMSAVHFTAAEPYSERVKQLKGNDNGVYNVGSLSIDNLQNLQLLSINEFREQFGINLSVPSILITFHPETVDYESNTRYVNEVINALQDVEGYQFIITMPNADTMGNMIRKRLVEFAKTNANTVTVESFGTIGYLSCMKHCSFLLGNTSSGFIEASFFPKYVINLGSRQNGRIVTPNISNCVIEKHAILNAIENYSNFTPVNINIYGRGNAAERILSVVKQINDRS